METGVSYNKQRLRKLGYFMELMSCNEEVNESIRPLLKLSRETVVRSQRLDYALIHSLERDPLLAERLKRLRTIPGVGPITALTWALEVGDVSRFQSVKQAVSYCGLCSAERSSADKLVRMPISKQRNKHIQQGSRGGRETGSSINAHNSEARILYPCQLVSASAILGFQVQWNGKPG